MLTIFFVAQILPMNWLEVNEILRTGEITLLIPNLWMIKPSKNYKLKKFSIKISNFRIFYENRKFKKNTKFQTFFINITNFRNSL